MTTAVLLMLLTGVVWAAVGVLFGAAPSERDRLYSFFATGNLVFCAFALAMRPTSAAPASRRKRCRGACRIFRGERLSPVGWTAVALDIIGIALLSCR